MVKLKLHEEQVLKTKHMYAYRRNVLMCSQIFKSSGSLRRNDQKQFLFAIWLSFPSVFSKGITFYLTHI